MEFTIFGTLPSLNEFISEVKKNKYSTMKRECQDYILWQIPKHKTFTKRVVLHFNFYEPNLKRDTDNISSVAHKFIQDALVERGLLIDDSQRYIKGHTDTFFVDRKNPRIEVRIEETGEDVRYVKGFKRLDK